MRENYPACRAPPSLRPQLKTRQEEKSSANDLDFLYWRYNEILVPVRTSFGRRGGTMYQRKVLTWICWTFCSKRQPTHSLLTLRRSAYRSAYRWYIVRCFIEHVRTDFIPWDCFLLTEEPRSKFLDKQHIKESRGRWQSLIPLPSFSAGESEGGSASTVRENRNLPQISTCVINTWSFLKK